MLVALSFVISSEALAAKKRKAKAGGCGAGIATSSVYFVPHIKDYCPTPKPCKAFKDEVRMQGSGTMSDNHVYTYTGKTRDIGDCDTAIGAAGECLIPFVSIAADPKFYSMGDVISMPAMKGKEIQLPNGKKMLHPGYFIVHDTGGAIKGPNRFDFFTGSFDDHNSNNAFGYDGFSDLAMTDIKSCNKKKQFNVVRRGNDKYDSIITAIDHAKLGMAVPKMMASSENNAGRSSGGGYVKGVN
ncbi:hypothetical protein AZI86_09640 [Bdellovibrio bacteriovorus]|uniref:3D domain-containing protein n=1 Tax=Bdellovibrio bacteriovorus TaxID=959 RepID=A0A150WSF8_BDEBC|nr:3D domain-containing protein [Bdellovibrio bacteriovorus]KYG67257.1 hypothetical protein AZI86_09640 [Bdellovibrio bacteriovorus]